MKKDLISVHDLSADEVDGLMRLAGEIKGEPLRFADALTGQSLAMVFQKSSTRTRVSFEVGMFQLGGQALFLSGRDIQLGRGETVSDTAKVLSGYVEGIMARVFDHADIEELAREASVPWWRRSFQWPRSWRYLLWAFSKLASTRCRWQL